MKDAEAVFGNQRSAVGGRLSAMTGRGLARRFAAGCVGAAMLAATAGAQMTGANKTPGSGSDVMTLHETVRLVVETVTVKDKQGKSVPGLTKKDFTVTEDGVPQTISFCELQSLPEVPDTPIADLTTHQAEENIKIYNKLAHEQIAGETPGKVMYQDKRLLALYFDDVGDAEPDRPDAGGGGGAEICADADDLGGPGVDHALCGQRGGGAAGFYRRPQPAAEHSGDDGGGRRPGRTTTSTSDDSASDTGAAFGQDDSEFNIFTTDRQLAALQTAAEMLGRLNEKKELIYFASGLNLNGLDNQAQLHATEDAAIRAGVAFWAVDARGLVADGADGRCDARFAGRARRCIRAARARR